MTCFRIFSRLNRLQGNALDGNHRFENVSRLLALDSGDLAMLTLLDLSSAFDIVDNDTLLQRLQRSSVLEDRCC